MIKLGSYKTVVQHEVANNLLGSNHNAICANSGGKKGWASQRGARGALHLATGEAACRRGEDVVPLPPRWPATNEE